MLPILNTENQQTITTIELRDLINQSRSGAGEPEVANRHFLARVEDELDGELSQRKSFTHPAKSQARTGMKAKLTKYMYANGAGQRPLSARSVDCLANKCFNS